jgi:hypothetical protein
VVPDSRDLADLSKKEEVAKFPKEGWYGISAGYLREIWQKCGEIKNSE